MAKILIPRSDSISAKNIVPTDFEKYFTNDIQDYVISGLSVSGSAGTNRSVDVTAGTARVKGYYLELDATDTAGYTFGTDDVHYLYLTLARDGNNEPESWGYSSNTTGTTPTDSIMIAKVTTAGGDVSAVDNSLEFKKMHHQTHFVGSGSEIGALSTTFPGMVAFCTKTEGDFSADSLYVRTSDNASWYPFSYNASYYGSGSDGSATNPSISGGDVKNYTDLTVSSTLSWGGAGPITIKCTGTFNLTGTINVTATDYSTTPNGGSGPQVASGGAGGKSVAPLFIFAKTITGTGTINMTAANGSNGGNAPGIYTGYIEGTVQATSSTAIGFGGKDISAEPGNNGVSSYQASNPSTTRGGGGQAVNSTYDVFGINTFYQARTGSGGGGGAGAFSQPQSGCNGGGGGGGGTLICTGGDGGISDNHGYGDSGGGGAGGGGSALIVLIADTCSAINLNLTGGDGGKGGNAYNGRCAQKSPSYVYGSPSGAGGGGGAAGALIITNAASNPTNLTLVAGAAGLGGDLGAECNFNGNAGNTKLLYVQKPTWMGIIGAGI